VEKVADIFCQLRVGSSAKDFQFPHA
jgi:hypothetical protein